VVDCFNQLLFRDIDAVLESNSSWRVDVKVLEKESLRLDWLVMKTSAGVSMSTSPNLKIERTVNSKGG
jgi:hypothetical protein